MKRKDKPIDPENEIVSDPYGREYYGQEESLLDAGKRLSTPRGHYPRDASNKAYDMLQHGNRPLKQAKKESFVGKEIKHLQDDKDYPHKRAVAAALNVARDKGIQT